MLCGGPGLEAGSREMNKKCMLTQRLGLKWGREIQAVIILSFKFDDSDDHRRLYKGTHKDGGGDPVLDCGGFLERREGGREGREDYPG